MSDETKQQWAYSTSPEEGYNELFDTREAAIADAVFGHGLDEGDTVYVGPIRRAELGIDNQVDWLLENAVENAELAEFVADRVISNLTKDRKRELGELLQATFDAWAQKHGICDDSFVVDPVDSYTVTAEDVAASLERERLRAESEASRANV